MNRNEEGEVRKCAPFQESLTPKPVGIWIRVSTEDQARGDSPEHHEKRARLYAEARDWQIKEVYRLEAVSGKSVISLPETQRMLEDVKHGHITGLIFSKLARLARNTRELLEFADIFRQYNADLISLQEAIDTSTPAGRLFYTMIAAMAQWEREEIAERVAASVPIRAKLGKPLGGAAPFGYQWKERKLIPDPNEAPVRKLIYELFLEHKRKKTVARLLNEMGHRTRNGAKFTDTTIKRLLRDTTAKGIQRVNYTKSLGTKKKWVLKPQDQWIHHQVESIIPGELWDRCNVLLDEQEKSHKKPARIAVHLFTGYAYCSCGQKMYVPSNSPKYTCYKCKNKILTADLEEIFHHQLRDYFFSSTEITSYLNNADKTIKEKESLLKSLIEEKNKTEKEMDMILQLYLDGKLSSNDVGRKHKPLSERLKQLDNQIPELQGEIDFLKIQYLSSDEIIHEAKDLYTRWPMLLSDEKRQVIENITEKVIIGKDDVTINLCYLPSPSERMTRRQHNFMAALPFCKVSLTAPKPLPSTYPQELITIGDHLRKRRLDLGLFQKEVANRLGTNESTVWSWENNQCIPSLRYLPKIINFLGYVPYNTTIESTIKTLGDKIVAYRKYQGISQKELARYLRIDPSTLGHWERNERTPMKKLLERLERFFISLPLTAS